MRSCQSSAGVIVLALTNRHRRRFGIRPMNMCPESQAYPTISQVLHNFYNLPTMKVMFYSLSQVARKDASPAEGIQ